MVIFTPNVTSKKVIFEAILPTTAQEDKLNQVISYSTANTRNETFTGTIKKFQINVNEMNSDNYSNLMFLFRNAITFQIKDTDTGHEDNTQYTFDGNSLNLGETRDKESSQLIYSGSISIISTVGS